jgi:hypothetical protein
MADLDSALEGQVLEVENHRRPSIGFHGTHENPIRRIFTLKAFRRLWNAGAGAKHPRTKEDRPPCGAPLMWGGRRHGIYVFYSHVNHDGSGSVVVKTVYKTNPFWIILCNGGKKI